MQFHSIFLNEDDGYLVNGYSHDYQYLFEKYYEPLFLENRVKAVITGDGGYHSKFYTTEINGIKYYQTGFGKYSDPMAFPLHGIIINKEIIY